MPSPIPTLTADDALAAARSMFMPTGDDLIGLECEWPVRDWRRPHERPSLGLVESVGEPGLPGGGRVTVEPGGQVELSSFPTSGVSAAIDQVNGDAEELHARLLSLGLDFEVRAVERSRYPERLLRKARYQSMEAFFDSRNSVGRWMMCNTASLQVNVSNDAADPYHRWHTLNRIAPALVAMFANSRGTDASGHSWASLRQGIWLAMDPGRTAAVRTDVDPAMAWLEYAMRAHVMLIRDSHDASIATGLLPGMTFADWMRNGCEAGFPTLEDLHYHFSTLFPPVRPRGWLELRVLDALPSWMRTAAALTVATVAQHSVSTAICAEIDDLSDQHVTAARQGLADPTLARAAKSLSRIVIENAHLVTCRPDHLDALRGFIERYTSQGACPGDGSTQLLPVCLGDALEAAVS